MSYCRFGEPGSDLYIYDSEDGVVCWSCRLSPVGDNVVTDYTGMLSHIQQHRTAGHAVPAHVDEELVTDAGYTPVRHRQCGETAFGFKDPAPMEPLTSARTLQLDGTHPTPGSELRCGSCGRRVGANSHDLDWACGDAD